MDLPKRESHSKQLDLWYAALQHLTSTELQLCRPMGRYINSTHKKTCWYPSNSNSYLYKKCENGAFETYRRAPHSQSSCRPKYVGCIPSSIPPLNPMNHKYAASQFFPQAKPSNPQSKQSARFLTYFDLGQTLDSGMISSAMMMDGGS